MRTTPEQFRDAWNASTSVQEAADRLGMVYGAAASRATRLRKAGVDIKTMTPPGRKSLAYTNETLQAELAKVYRGKSREDRFWELIDVRGPDECWIWRGTISLPNHNGFQYGKFSMLFNGRSWNFRAHRLAWAIDRRRSPRGKTILHQCDVPLCVNPRHLSSGTAADNHTDRNQKGRTACGRMMPNAILTEDLVRQIRRSDRTDEYWAKLLGCGTSCILKARRGLSWQHVQE